MRQPVSLFLILFTLIIQILPAGEAENILETSSLEAWNPQTFDKIPLLSRYTVVQEDGAPAIRIESDASASGLIYSQTFSLSETPYLSWSWKSMTVYEMGNAESKKGDDYPIRVYILFEYSKDRVPFFLRVKYELIRLIYGEYPPTEVISYVWANRPHSRQPLPNAYTGRVMMYFPDAGTEHLGEWRNHRVDIPGDFRRAFDTEPPDTFTLAIMGDADNTGDRGISFIRDIRLSSR